MIFLYITIFIIYHDIYYISRDIYYIIIMLYNKYRSVLTAPTMCFCTNSTPKFSTCAVIYVDTTESGCNTFIVLP